MCFSQNQSGIFALVGLTLAGYIKYQTTNTGLAIGVFWFFLMELLQYFQFFWIDDCDHPMNQFLTFLGYLHIAYQPYFTHVINSSMARSPRLLDQYTIVKRLCLLGGTMYLMRVVLYDFLPQYNTPVNSDFTIWAKNEPLPGSFRTREWLRGEQLCTYRGKYHLAWSIPMLDNTYWIPSQSIHSFLMFAPFFIMRKGMMIFGFFLWLSGPFLSIFFTDNLQEQGSIWCFFSIAQIFVMLFLVRGTLVQKWGRNKKELNQVQQKSTLKDQQKSKTQ